ncbi:carboxypeptidase regulatory-like domain-containing protein [Myxococcus fulvus]|uniref:carboxypeptidase regulatory-like domain-containing protein n=1 Tax=Myxococcus fulvus TaxID=33 RepID=UPI003B9C10F1
MRGWIVGGIVAGVLALLAWVLWGDDVPSETPREEAAQRSESSFDGLARRSPPMPRPRTRLAIRGTVMDGLGRPVAGARVSASSPEDGATLSTIPCPREDLPSWATPDEEPASPWLLAECLPQSEDVLVSLLLARQGEAPVHAETRSTEDGTYVLDDLPEGHQVLLALSEHGAVSRMGVSAGSQDVELMLEQPTFIQGQVLGEDNAPLSGVSLTLVSTRHTRFFDSHTDVRGEFKLGPVPHDTYLLLAAKEGWRPVLVQTSSQAAALEVRMHPSHRLSGRVMSGGLPVKGVEVVVGPAKPFSGGLPFRVTTDSGGHFELELSTGSFLVTAQREGQSALARVTLGGSSIPEVLLRLGEARQLEGTLRDDTTGAAVAGARVTLFPRGLQWMTLETTTGADGRYRVGPVEPGEWLFSLRSSGYVASIHWERTLSPDLGPKDFTLRRGVPIAGHVVDDAGQPMGNVALSLENVNHGYRTYEEVRTAPDGSFSLEASSPGDFWVIARSNRYVTKRVTVQAPMTDLRITLSTGGAVEGTLTDSRGQPVSGFTVLVAPLNGNIADGFLSAPDTNTQGQFSRGGILPGRYRVQAEQVALSVERKAWTVVEVKEGAVAKVDLRLPTEHALEGIIVDTSGHPIQGASIRVQPREPASTDDEGQVLSEGAPPGVLSDAKGRFVLQGLRDMDHLVDAVLPGHELRPEHSTGGSPSEGEVLVGAEARQLRLVMKRHAHVRGRLVGPDGAPLRKFHVDRNQMTSPDGSFSVPFHEGSRERFIFHAEGTLKVARIVDGGRDGPDIDLGEIRLEAGRELRGVVRDARMGTPVPYAVVSLAGEEAAESEPSIQAYADGNGLFVLGPVPLRPLTLRSRGEAGTYLEQRTHVDSSQQEVTVWMSAIAPERDTSPREEVPQESAAPGSP